MSLRTWSALVLVLPLMAGCSPERKTLKIVFPEGFEGAAAIVYGVASAPPLPREGAMLLVEIPKDGILKTSSPLETDHIKDEMYQRKGSELVAIPEAQKADRTTGSYRSCASVEELFIGDKAKLATMRTALNAKLDPVCGAPGAAPGSSAR